VDQFTADGVVLEEALAYWVHRVYQATRNESFRAFRDAGEEITPEQWVVLARLWQEDGRTQTELGESTWRDRPTMSRILDGMEKRGLLVRRASAEDGRAWRVHLTPRGKALEARLVPVARRIVEQSLRGVSKADLATTRATLQKVFANLTREG
jgi:MarR family transcriptional regulator, organic hydroperoxide resistance regulator